MTAPTVPAGWQVVLADLSLILFIVTATAVASRPPLTTETDTAAQQPMSQPEQVFSSVATGDGIGDWLASYASDPRERLRITIHYRREEFSSALARAKAVRTSAGSAGHHPLITLEEDKENRTTATFAFEGAPEQLARGLQ